MTQSPARNRQEEGEDGESSSGLSISLIGVAVERAINGMWQRRLTYAVSLVLCVAIGTAYLATAPREYEASTKILPYTGAAAGSSGVSTLAAAAGIRVAATSDEPVISAALYPEVIATARYQATLARTPLGLTRDGKVRTFLGDHLSQATGDQAAQDAASVELAAARLSLSDSVTDREASSDGQRTIITVPSELADALGELFGRVNVDVSGRTGVVTIRARMPDPTDAARLADAATAVLMQTIVDFESARAKQQLQFADNELAEAKRRLSSIQLRQARQSDQTRNAISSTSQLQLRELDREQAVAFDLYRQFATEREQARVRLNQDTPAFAVLEPAVVPSRPVKPSPSQILATAVLVGLLLGLVASTIATALAERKR